MEIKEQKSQSAISQIFWRVLALAVIIGALVLDAMATNLLVIWTMQ